MKEGSRGGSSCNKDHYSRFVLSLKANYAPDRPIDYHTQQASSHTADSYIAKPHPPSHLLL